MNEKEIKRVAELYNKRASSGDNLKAAGQWGTEELAEKITKEIHKRIELDKHKVVLEVGCGSGVLGSTIVDRCLKYVGFDASLNMLNLFGEYDTKKIPNLLQATSDILPFKDGLFDLVIMNGVTMYFPNTKFLLKTLEEISRVANNNEIIFIGENIIPSRQYWEFVWVNKLSPIKQKFVKPYIQFRIWISNHIPQLAGKWSNIHKSISPDTIKKYFSNKGQITMIDAAACSVRQKIGKNSMGNRRVDFLIKLNQE